jgi:hypothetical protein
MTCFNQTEWTAPIWRSGGGDLPGEDADIVGRLAAGSRVVGRCGVGIPSQHLRIVEGGSTTWAFVIVACYSEVGLIVRHPT